MARLPLNPLLLSLSLLGAFLGLGVNTALAQLCEPEGGRPRRPCECGDTLALTTRETVLDPKTSPVCSKDASQTCSGVGLKVQSFTRGTQILHLDGCTIRGASGSTIGIDAVGTALVPNREVWILNGRIEGFDDAGIRMRGELNRVSQFTILGPGGPGIVVEGSSTTVADNLILERGVGIRIGDPVGGRNGTANVIDNNVVDGRGAVGALTGIEVVGNSNVVTKNRFENNAGTGIEVRGSTNMVTSNRSKNNAGRGLTVMAGLSGLSEGNILVDNRCTNNGSDGIVVFGFDNALTSNRSQRNGGDGISVVGGEVGLVEKNTLEDNFSTDNAGTGISVVGTGHGCMPGFGGVCNILIHNFSARNGSDGIFVDGSGQLMKNQGVNNRGRGVFAGPGNEGGSPGQLNYGSGNRTPPNCEINGMTISRKWC